MADFLVKRDDLRECRVAESQAPSPESGQAVLRIEAFGLTANNITYAVFGDAMNYWDFFPAEEGWGRVPMWGFASVAESAADGLEEGGRVYGYLPPSTHLLIEPKHADALGFVDGSPHRAHLPTAYHRYLLNETDPLYTEEHEDQLMLLRPLFFTSFLIDDDLGDGGLAGAGRVVLSSASSKTAIGTAFQVAKREGLEVIGLTSPGNVEFVEGLGIYSRTVPYEDIESLDLEPTAFIDIAGDDEVAAAVHHHLGDSLVASISVGATHWEEFSQESADLPGPKRRFFFAPDRIVKRVEDWGRDGLGENVASAWRPFVEWTADWLEVERGDGMAAVQSAYTEVIEGKVPPAKAHVLRL